MSLKTWLNESPGALAIEAEEKRVTEPRIEIARPFDPRSEVSADAKAIMSRLTVLLFWIPLAAAILIGLIVAVFSTPH
jgi:hypothetical protein